MNKWDIRFLDMARMVSTWSKDPSTQTGAVIATEDRKGIFIGYNGFPQKMLDLPENYENREQKYSRIVHCEMNAILVAGEKAKGSTLYTYPFASCDRCFVHMVQGGITRFVAPILPDHLQERWGASLEKVRGYAAEMNLELNEIDYPGYNSAYEKAETFDQEARAVKRGLGQDYEEVSIPVTVRGEVWPFPKTKS